MKSRTLSATAMILLTPLVVLAFQAQADQISKSELKSRPFSAGLLKITLAEFYLGNLAKTNGRLIIVAQNTSEDFVTFDPRRLSFIDTDGNQADILGITGYDGRIPGTVVVAAESKRIGPKAKISNLYELTDKVRLPARLYYEDKLLGTIIN
jgi:hypothetical protein